MHLYYVCHDPPTAFEEDGLCFTTNVASILDYLSLVLESNAHALEDYKSKVEVKSKKEIVTLCTVACTLRQSS